MKTLSALMISVALLTGSTALAATKDAKDVDTAIAVQQFDKTSWVKAVSSSNMFEIESSKLALQKSKSDEVKKFAQMMVDDHTKAGEKLAKTLKKDGDAAPPKELAPKHVAAMKLLESLEGQDFDMAYISLQHAGHMEAVAAFRTYAANPDDKALGAFAKETLPTLELHFEHVKALAAM